MEAARAHLHLVDTATGEARYCETCGGEISHRYPNGEPIYPARYATRRYCSTACVRPDVPPPVRRSENPSPQAGRQRARRKFTLRACERCGSPGQDRHHIDGDTSNNDPSNVAILCRRCHMEADGRLKAFVAMRNSFKPQPPKPCTACGKPSKPLRRGMCSRCYQRERARAT